jgi:LmbE family N-acetylglucosaminyl deacetylase
VGDGTRIAVLHLSPHPDDELLGAPATLMGLRDAGHRVLNLACGLGGSHEQRRRRRRELSTALALAHIEGTLLDPPLAIAAPDDVDSERQRLSRAIRALVAREGFKLVVGPTPHDAHPTHEVVGRAAVDAIAGLPDPPRLWMWALWGDLPLPTLFVPFDGRRRDEVLRALAAYEGEVARNDYAAAYEGRCRADRVLGVERTFGFGEPRGDGPYSFLLEEQRPYAELLTEVVRVGEAWCTARPRIPEFADPLAGADPGLPIGWWLEEASVRDRMRRIATGAKPAPGPR